MDAPNENTLRMKLTMRKHNMDAPNENTLKMKLTVRKQNMDALLRIH